MLAVIIRLFVLLLGALVLVAPAAAQSGKRVALVIANAAYSNVPRLTNPPADAALVAGSLRRAGFSSVITVRDADKAALESALQRFGAEAEGADVAMVYYAGHGIEVAGRNFLIPVSARLVRERDADVEAVALDTVLRQAEGAKLRLVVLDACRENPFAVSMTRAGQGRSIGRGLGRVEPDGDTLVVYAAKAGAIAADGDGANSPFARALSTRIVEPGLEISLLFRRVRDDVLTATRRQQEPFTYGSLSGSEFYFVPLGSGGAAKPAATAYAPPMSVGASGSGWRKITARDLDLGSIQTLARQYGLSDQVEDIKAAARGGDASAAALLGALFQTNTLGVTDYAESGRWAKQAADAGNASGMIELGSLYMVGGGGFPKDDTQALALYERAAKLGSKSALVGLGIIHENGKAVAADSAKAYAYYRQAADQGQQTALGYVAASYLGGHGVAKDEAQALAWARRGGEVDDPMSLNIVALLYDRGAGGLPRDPSQALPWFKRAFEAGMPIAGQSVASYYETGAGVAQDRDEAKRWYRRAADAGDPASMNALGIYAERGWAGAADPVAAAGWYARAANAGHKQGMLNYATVLDSGTGVGKDPANAKLWRERAAAIK